MTGYFPCKPSGDKPGLQTVYNQHRAHLQQIKDDREPHQAWLEDFQKELSTWIKAGENLVVKLDANSDVRTGKVAQLLQSLGLKEQITTRHQANHPPPATHLSNSKAIPIDGIWTNFGHGTMRCGFLGFEAGLPGDHRTAWIDIPLRTLLGHNPPDMHRVYPPDLAVGDPRARDKYNSNLKQCMKAAKLQEKAAQLRQMVSQNLANPDNPPHTLALVDALHLQINNTRRDLGWKSAKKVHKKHTGAFPYTPHVSKLLSRVELWSKVIYYRTHKKVGSRQIRRLMKKHNMTDAFRVTIGEAVIRRRKLRKDLRRLREQKDQLRRAWVNKLCEAKVKAKGQKKATTVGEVKNHYATERMRHVLRMRSVA